MKRISLWLAMLVFAPGIVEAVDYVPPRYRTHYSPYAFSYHKSGMVPGGLDYSSQAFSYRHSGLVPEGVRYTPYLLRYGHSGLVIDYYGYSTSSDHYAPACGSRPVCVPVRHAPVGGPRACAVENRGPNPIETIRRCLQDKGHHDVNINQVLMIDSKLVSADFFLKDRNLIIKYWNPSEIESLKTQKEYKQTGYEKYREKWMEVAAQHEQNGGRIHCVEASGTEAIVAALDSCDELNANPEETDQAVLYARN
ncbi:MAG: hypothetical protein KBE65_19620 [Phycisphaerae bacterium]|nr:hypothetical protein [Phycisphaerae bacterium]